MALSAAIILAAGEGTRMRSNKPKVLHTLAGNTFLNRVMDSVAALDPDTLAVVVHYQAERVAEAARSYNEHVTIVDQDDIPGTGRAVQCAMAQLTQKDDLDGAVLIAASDMPLLDTRREANGVTGEFIADMVLQLRSYGAHFERDNIRQSQAEGFSSARARGVRFGRPRIERPDAFETGRGLYSSGGLTCAEAAEACGVSESTFRRWIRALEDGR